MANAVLSEPCRDERHSFRRGDPNVFGEGAKAYQVEALSMLPEAIVLQKHQTLHGSASTCMTPRTLPDRHFFFASATVHRRRGRTICAYRRVK